MRILEYGKERQRTLLFLPCTAEPDWAFTDAVTLLAQEFHVLQVIYDGHGGTGEDFVSVEKTVDEITNWLQGRGITCLDAAYGCSLGGACLTRLLAEGKLPVGRAVIDAGITPYQLPLLLRRLACLRDTLAVRLVMRNRKILEAAYPPERWTLPGRDPVQEYDALSAYLRTYSNRSIRNIFWSANNDPLPPEPAETDCRIAYWYGGKEAKARRGNIRFIRRYFPQAQIHVIPEMEHAELVMLHPEEFYRQIELFMRSEE